MSRLTYTCTRRIEYSQSTFGPSVFKRTWENGRNSQRDAGRAGWIEGKMIAWTERDTRIGLFLIQIKSASFLARPLSPSRSVRIKKHPRGERAREREREKLRRGAAEGGGGDLADLVPSRKSTFDFRPTGDRGLDPVPPFFPLPPSPLSLPPRPLPFFCLPSAGKCPRALARSLTRTWKRPRSGVSETSIAYGYRVR